MNLAKIRFFRALDWPFVALVVGKLWQKSTNKLANNIKQWYLLVKQWY